MTGQDDWLSHKSLQIVKGIGATPGDTYSAENAPRVVNLMSGIISLEDWSPNIPAIKGGGVWASSPISDGRTLLAAPVGNVVEKMSIRITDTSYLGIMTQMTALNQMVQDCRDYWQSDYQIDPVYLMWYASCGAGPQYALISNIDLAPEYEQSPSPSIRVSITIEREPAWRGIPPGANPKIWTYEVNQSNPQFNLGVASLVSGTDHLITATLQNKHEWSPTAAGLQVTPITKNYVDIPANLVPGDSPALCQIIIEPAAATLKPINTFISSTSNPFLKTGHDGIARAQSLIFNAGDSQSTTVSITKTVVATDLGVLSNNSAVNSYVGIRTVTGIDANWVVAADWGVGAPTTFILKLDRNIYRGTFAVFVRAYNTSAAAPLIGDMRMRVRISEMNQNVNISTTTTAEASVPLLDTNLDYSLTYMGTVTIPSATRSVVSGLGYGQQITESFGNFRVEIDQRVDVATANRTFTLIDVILMPIDQGIAHIITNPVTDNTLTSIGLDNTGYFGKGSLEQLAFSFNRSASDIYVTNGAASQEVRGQNILLKPGAAQRLYFINNFFVATAASREGLRSNFTVRLNIVPRWFGIRNQ